MPTAEIISIGSELLLGQIIDTNAAWMARRFTDLGVDVYFKTIVGDNPVRMNEVIKRALDRSDIVITGGGLGPTEDDLTRQVIAQATGRRLIRDRELSEQIDNRFRNRGLIMTPNNEKQADIPEGAIPVENPNGTAPSFIVEEAKSVIFALPGVPFELKWLFDNEVSKYLKKRFDLSETLTYKVLKVADLGESSVDDLIGHLIINSSNPTVGVLAHPGQVDIRIAAKSPNVDEARNLISGVEDKVRDLLGDHIFAVDDETMETNVGKLLNERNLTVSVHEDLTGGMLSERVQMATHKLFIRGVVSSGSQSIRQILSCSHSQEDIDSILADPVLLTDELASAVRIESRSNYGLALHAYSDPLEKAENLGAGETYISVTDGSKYRRRTYSYGGRGIPDRIRMSLNALELLRSVLITGFKTD